jgi:hypothetical protein
MSYSNFSWNQLDQSFLRSLAKALSVSGDAADGLVNRYGPTPEEAFIREAWPTLMDEWLEKDANACTKIASELRDRGVGDTDQANDIQYLRSCRNAKGLREVVLVQFLLSAPSRRDAEQAKSENQDYLRPIIQSNSSISEIEQAETAQPRVVIEVPEASPKRGETINPTTNGSDKLTGPIAPFMASTPMQKQEPGQIEIDGLLSWLEQQPELEPLRAKANSLMCAYRPGEANPAQRIVLNDMPELNPESQNILQKLKEVIWVPARSLRGKAFATPELDGQLNRSAKIMSIASLWDFITTIPLFQFSLAGPLGAAALPGAIVTSFLLLWGSNVAGENSTDQRRGHASKAIASLVTFALLTAAKTAFSGVGVDLMIGSQRIASVYAAELAAQKLEKDKAELKRLETAGADYQTASVRCTDLENQMKALDRNSNEKQFISLYVLAFGSNASKVADQGLTPSKLIGKYGSVGRIPGICNQRDFLQTQNIEKAKPLAMAIERNSQAIAQKPPLTYLEQNEPDLFKDNFRLDQQGRLEWVNGTDAVSQATKQFYASLSAGKYSELGPSLLVLSISILLTGLATALLYQSGKNTEVQASFTGELEDFRNERLDQYEQALQTKLLAESHAQPPAETGELPPIGESEAMDARSLRWIRMNGRTSEDKAIAKRRYQEIIFDLWRKHIARTGETYYPKLRNDMSDHAMFMADPDHR